jgi:hypothetical protein
MCVPEDPQPGQSDHILCHRRYKESVQGIPSEPRSHTDMTGQVVGDDDVGHGIKLVKELLCLQIPGIRIEVPYLPEIRE